MRSLGASSMANDGKYKRDTHSKFLVSFGHEPGGKVVQALLFSFVGFSFNIITDTTSLESLLSNVE